MICSNSEYKEIAIGEKATTLLATSLCFKKVDQLPNIKEKKLVHQAE